MNWAPFKSFIYLTYMPHAFRMSIKEPITITRAMEQDDSKKWKKAKTQGIKVL